VQITFGKIRKYSITLVIISWSYSRQISTIIAFSDCILQSSQVWHWCQNFHFEIFLVDSRMASYRGVSTTWWGVYPVPVMAPFTRWCQFIARNQNAMRICMVMWPTVKSLYMLSSRSSPCTKLPLMVEFFPCNSDWESLDLYLLCRCWIIFPKSYLDFSCLKPCRFIASTSPPEVVFWYCAFLLKSLKLDGTALLHLLAPYHVHHDCTIT
jgi:hypothetical protein